MTDSIYVSKDGRMKERVKFLCRSRMASDTLEEDGQFPNLILESNQGKIESFLVNMTTATIFEAIIFFYRLSVLNGGLQKRKVTVPQAYHVGTLIWLCV